MARGRRHAGARGRNPHARPTHRTLGPPLALGPGQLGRLLDVPGDRDAGFGVFDNGGPNRDAAALAKSIKLAAVSNYGTAGPAFVRKLIDEGVTGEDVRELVGQFVRATIPGEADG